MATRTQTAGLSVAIVATVALGTAAAYKYGYKKEPLPTLVSA